MSGTDPDIREFRVALTRIEARQEASESEQRQFWRTDWQGLHSTIQKNHAEVRETLVRIDAHLEAQGEEIEHMEGRLTDVEEQVGKIKMKIATFSGLGAVVGAAAGEIFRVLWR